MSLSVRAVSYAYPGASLNAVEEVSFTLEDGLVVALVGANGAGKSTLLSLASGRQAPRSGTVSINGTELSALSPRGRARAVSLLPQSERVPFDFTCLEFALFGTAPRLSAFSFPGKMEREEARAALKGLGVYGLADRPVTAVSGGELQLVRIARCVVQNTGVLLLDEPTAMLDPGHARAVGSAIASSAASGRCVLFSTHDLAFASAVADLVLVLCSGRAVAFGPPAAVLTEATLENAFGVPFERRLIPVPVRP